MLAKATRIGRIRPVRNALLCPQCQGQRFFEIERIIIPHHEYTYQFAAFTLTAAYTETEEGRRGLFGGAEKEQIGVGASAFVCASCG